jgi:uncharacterized protein YhjY with autotransporter beta-barrel domain
MVSVHRRVVHGGGGGGFVSRVALLLSTLLGSVAAFSQTPSDALSSLARAGQLNPFESVSAITNETVYNTLLSRCTGNSTCTGRVFDVFSLTRELVETAEEIRSGTDLQHGLNLDVEGLGFALRWTAAEELLAQGSTLKQFANSQSSVLGGRIAAIRTISRANLLVDDLRELVRTGYASAEGGPPAAAGYSGPRWSAFFDAAGGHGDKRDTTFGDGFEDAFDFEGYEYSLGADYRISNNLVAGGILGYTDRYIDFDSSQSIVDGNISSKGVSLLGFVQWDQQWFYAAGSLGYQQLDFDTLRRISYPSFDPNITSTNTATAGSTDSSAILASLNLGVPFQWKAFGADLYLKADYQNTTIHSFEEKEAVVANQSGEGFEFDIAGQKIRSLNSAAGLKLQMVWTPSFGVFVPFVRGEYHRELEDSPRTIRTVYAGLPDDVAAQIQANVAGAFALQSDPADSSYYTVSGGFSAVIRGSNRISSAGRAGGGLQGYLQYTKVLKLRSYSDSVIAGGLRYEF